LNGQAQIDTSLLTMNIYAAEDSMVAVSKRKDWNTYADYMHSVVIEMSGGKEGFIQILESQSEILDSVQPQGQISSERQCPIGERAGCRRGSCGS